MTTSRVSLLIPSYNSAATIRETLESVQANQEALRNLLGVWIADDGSTDSTVDVARAAWRSDCSLEIISDGRNHGQWRNVNQSFDRLGEFSDWILILHSDDLVMRGWLGSMLKTIDSASPTLGAIGSYYDYLLSDGNTRLPGTHLASEPTLFRGDPQTVRYTLRRGCWWHISSSGIRVAAYRDVGPFREEFDYSADWEWLTRCLQGGWDVQYLSEALHVRRLSPEGVAGGALAHDRDVEQALLLIAKYPHSLSKNELRTFHAFRANVVLRRSVRALLNRRLGRLALSARTMGKVLRSYSKLSKMSA